MTKTAPQLKTHLAETFSKQQQQQTPITLSQQLQAKNYRILAVFAVNSFHTLICMLYEYVSATIFFNAFKWFFLCLFAYFLMPPTERVAAKFLVLQEVQAPCTRAQTHTRTSHTLTHSLETSLLIFNITKCLTGFLGKFPFYYYYNTTTNKRANEQQHNSLISS